MTLSPNRRVSLHAGIIDSGLLLAHSKIRPVKGFRLNMIESNAVFTPLSASFERPFAADDDEKS